LQAASIIKKLFRLHRVLTIEQSEGRSGLVNKMIKSVMTHSTPDRASSNTTDGTNGSPQRVNRLFSAIAQETSRQTGRAWVFALTVGTIVVWAITGPFFNFSDTWQLLINTGTTIVTFLMVFLIQTRKVARGGMAKADQERCRPATPRHGFPSGRLAK
jgi:hypothetical protein